MLLSNTPVQNFEAYWATDGLHLIAQVIAELRGEDPNGGWTTLTSNSVTLSLNEFISSKDIS